MEGITAGAGTGVGELVEAFREPAPNVMKLGRHATHVAVLTAACLAGRYSDWLLTHEIPKLEAE